MHIRKMTPQTIVAMLLLFQWQGAAYAQFSDVTASADISYQQHTLTDPPDPSTFRESHYMSGGAAAADYNGDGWVDLFVTRLNASDILYRNNGDGTFTDVTNEVGFPHIDGSNGAAWGDVDADGDPDLYITSLDDGRFYLLINDAGTFTDQSFQRGVALAGFDEHHGMSAAFGDINNDGFLDLHTNEWRPDGVNILNQPANTRLFLNRGSGQIGVFDDITESAGVGMDNITPHGMSGTFTFTSRFADMDLDGYTDLLITGDFGTSRIFWNNGDNTFTDGTDLAGVGTDENGMGSAIGDINNDGLPDWLVTAIYDPSDTCGATPDCFWGTTGNRMYLNNGDRTFTDVTDQAGVRDGSWGWAATFIDYDNDGDLDIAQATGQNFPNEESFLYDDPYENDALRFWENDGTGIFTEKALLLGLTDTGSAKALLKFDYDRDGDEDLFIVNNGGEPKLYRNDTGNLNDWLQFECVSQGHCIGAVIRVQTEEGGPAQYREMHASSNFLGQDWGTTHFGLGSNVVNVNNFEVTWPNGIIQSRSNVASNTIIQLFHPLRINGTTGNDILYGENGDDVINGLEADDQLDGGLGNDTLDGGSGNDVLLGNLGDDTLFGSDGADQLSGGEGNDQLSGGSGNDSLSGDAGDDALNGDDGNDVLTGGPGADNLQGGPGTDLLWGNEGNDNLNGGDDADELHGGTGNDTLDGADGNDTLIGESGDDTLDSGPGGDTLYAGDGADIAYFDFDDVDGMSDLYDGGLGIDVLDLRLSPEQLADPAIDLEIHQFANFVSVNLNPNTESGIPFTFSTLGLNVRNFEVFQVNGVAIVGDTPVVYIDPDAPDGGSGSLLSPFNDWNQVIFQPGVTYKQKSGTTFSGTIHIDVSGTADNPITISRYETIDSGEARPKIIGSVVMENVSYVSLESLDISAGAEVAITMRGGDHASVIDCEISYSSLGVWMIEGSGPGNVVRSNLIHNNDSHGVAASQSDGVAGDETYIDHNSIYANGVHGIEIESNYIIVERNEVAYNGWREGGTSGIHVFSFSPDADAAHHNIIRHNVTSNTYEFYGPDGNGIELDKWSSDNDVYGNIVYNNGGQGLNMFRSDSFHVFDNIVFDNMKSTAHLNFARPTEVFIGSFSLDNEDQVFDFVVQDNIIVANGDWAGSGNTNIISILIDAPTIFNTRVIQNNRYYSTTDGNFFLYGYDPGLTWGGGVGGNDINTWNELKVNGQPDLYGGVTYQVGSGILAGGTNIDILLGEDNDDELTGAENDDLLLGLGGNDILDGGSGADRMLGGRGNDTYYVDDLNDQIIEFPESGADTVYSLTTFNLPRHVDNLKLNGTDPINGLGNDERNFLVGNDAANSLDGRAGIDILQGLGGDDYLQGGAGNDFLDGGEGNDIVYGGLGSDILTGGTGDDVFIFVKGEGTGAVLDFEGNQSLLGDLLKFVGYGPGATITYTGADGVYRIDYLEGNVPASETVTLVGVVGLHPVDYVFE